MDDADIKKLVHAIHTASSKGGSNIKTAEDLALWTLAGIHGVSVKEIVDRISEADEPG